jgi:hypothetical protein
LIILEGSDLGKGELGRLGALRQGRKLATLSSNCDDPIKEWGYISTNSLQDLNLIPK